MYDIASGIWQVKNSDLSIEMIYRKDTNDWNTIQSIITEDEYLSQKIKCEDSEKTVFIDIGAHIGGWSALMNHLYPRSLVIAVEALHENFELLRMNLDDHNSIVINRAAFKKDDDFVDISYGDAPEGHHRFIGNAAIATAEPKDAIVVSTISLDTLCASHSRIRVLKIDCEGAEYEILAGASKETLKKIDCIIGEHHFFSPTQQGRDDLFKIVKSQFKDVTQYSGLPISEIPIGEFLFVNKSLTETIF